MIHDPLLLEQLSALPTERFEGVVFRATRVNLDPLAPSISGGRWAPRGDARHQVPVLYTSLEREGALAEVAFHWGQLTPRPSKPAVLHELSVTTDRTLKLIKANLEELGVDMSLFSVGDYKRTQEIGAATAFLDCDGLLVPSARWDCDHLVVFSDNHDFSNELRVLGQEEINLWSWAAEVGFDTDTSTAS